MDARNPHRRGSASARLFDRLFNGDLWFPGGQHRVHSVEPLRLPNGSYQGLVTQRNGWRWVVEVVLVFTNGRRHQVSMGSDSNVTTCAEARALSGFLTMHDDIEIIPDDA